MSELERKHLSRRQVLAMACSAAVAAMIPNVTDKPDPWSDCGTSPINDILKLREVRNRYDASTIYVNAVTLKMLLGNTESKIMAGSKVVVYDSGYINNGRFAKFLPDGVVLHA